MKSTVIVIGLGEMGGVFGRAFLTAGHPVVPVRRGDDAEAVAAAVPEPLLALVAVAESDLDGVLATAPAPWRDRLGLLQNELLPRDWLHHGIADPTVIAVWFEKKAGRPVSVILSSPVYGPAAGTLVDSLAAISIPAHEVASAGEMELELVAKNLYILVANIAGLVSRGTVGELWSDHHGLAERVAHDVLAIQAALVGRPLSRDDLVGRLEAAFAVDPDHGAMGRSAPARLARGRAIAAELGVAAPTLDDIAAHTAGAADP